MRSVLKRLYAYAYAYVLMRTLPHKHRVCECFSLVLAFLKRLYSNVCHILLCVVSLTNIGFVQCLFLGPLYAYLCHVMLCYAYFASQTSMSYHSVLHFDASTRFCFAFHFG